MAEQKRKNAQQNATAKILQHLNATFIDQGIDKRNFYVVASSNETPDFNGQKVTCQDGNSIMNCSNDLSSLFVTDSKSKFTFPAFSLPPHIDGKNGVDKGQLQEVASFYLSQPLTYKFTENIFPPNSVGSGISDHSFAHRDISDSQSDNCTDSYVDNSDNSDTNGNYPNPSNKFLTEVPKKILTNLLSSVLLLIHARLRAYAIILERHFNAFIESGILDEPQNNADSTNKHFHTILLLALKQKTLCEIMSNIKVQAATAKFHAIGSNDEGAEFSCSCKDGAANCSMPIGFEAVIDILVPLSSSLTMKLQAPGNITSCFEDVPNSVLRSATVCVDTRTLIASMINHAGGIAEKVVQNITSYFAEISNDTCQVELSSNADSHFHNEVPLSELMPPPKPRMPKPNACTMPSNENTISIVSPDLSSASSPTVPSLSSLPPAIDGDCAALVDNVMEAWDDSFTVHLRKKRKLSSFYSQQCNLPEENIIPRLF